MSWGGVGWTMAWRCGGKFRSRRVVASGNQIEIRNRVTRGMAPRRRGNGSGYQARTGHVARHGGVGAVCVSRIRGRVRTRVGAVDTDASGRALSWPRRVTREALPGDEQAPSNHKKVLTRQLLLSSRDNTNDLSVRYVGEHRRAGHPPQRRGLRLRTRASPRRAVRVAPAAQQRNRLIFLAR